MSRHLDDGLQREILDDEMDLLLREVEGGIPPPDLVVSILRRHEAGDGVTIEAYNEQEASKRWRHRPVSEWLLMAGLLLVGIGVPVLIFLLDGEPDQNTERPASEQGASIASPSVVRSAKDIQRLPPNTQAVRCVGIDGAELEGFGRLRELRYLELTGHDRNEVTDVDFYHLKGCTKLEGLVLSDLEITGRGLVALEDASNLRRLVLNKTRLDQEGMDRVLAFEQLTHLDISTTLSVTDAMMLQVLTLRGLRYLNISGCGMIGEGTLLRLGELKQLRHLELAGLVGWTEIPFGMPGVRATAVTGDVVGVDDRVLKVIQRDLSFLEVLNIAGCVHVSSRGLASLTRIESLRSLDLSFLALNPRELMTIAKRGGWQMLGIPLPAGLHGEELQAVFGQLQQSSPALHDLRLTSDLGWSYDLQPVSGFVNLRELSLSNVAVREGGLSGIIQLRRLEVLMVSRSLDVVRQLPALPGLREVQLFKLGQVSAEDLNPLLGLPSLEVLRSRQTVVPAAFWQRLPAHVDVIEERSIYSSTGARGR